MAPFLKTFFILLKDKVTLAFPRKAANQALSATQEPP